METLNQSTDLAYFYPQSPLMMDACLLSCGKDDRGSFVLLDRTVFHPQGGGQPSDRGIIQLEGVEYTVIHVKLEGQKVYHYLNTEDLPECRSQEPVTMIVDSEMRKIYSQIHTAGHLVGHVIEEMISGMRAIKGHHFPGESYIEFKGESGISSEDVSRINIKLNEICQKKVEVMISFQEPDRSIQIGKYNPVRCGGTHLHSLSELKEIEITKVKFRKDVWKVSYRVS